MKCVELKVRINVPDNYDCSYPYDLLMDAIHRYDMEIDDVNFYKY